MCVHSHTYTHVCLSVDLVYACVMYVHTCGYWHLWAHKEVRGGHQVPWLPLFTLFPQTGFLSEPGARQAASGPRGPPVSTPRAL